MHNFPSRLRRFSPALALSCLPAILPCVPAHAQPAAPWTADDFVSLSQSPSPDVAYALRREGETLRVALAVESLAPSGTDAGAQMGLAAAGSVVLTSATAKVARTGPTLRYDWAVPFKSLIAAPADWAKLRMGLAVTWKGGPGGADRERERFGFAGARAPHGAFTSDPAQWLPLSLNEYAAIVQERKLQLALNFVQPLDGKATLVIEDALGRRVRNLVSGRPMSKGAQRLVWDGLDDDGRVAPPGAYRWRAISHAGIAPHHLLTFADGPGSNHGILQSAASNGKWTFLATNISEGGHDIVAFDANGEMKGGYVPPLGMGILSASVAADDKYIYLVKDGRAQYQKVDTTRPDWKAPYNVSLLRLAIDGGQIVEYPGGQRFATITSQEVGPGSAAGINPDKNFEDRNVRGIALLGGKLYLSSRASSALLVFDPATAKPAGEIKLDKPGPIAAAGASLIAVSANKVVKIEPGTGQVTPLFNLGEIDARGLAADAAGEIYISDGKSSTVRVFDAAGKALRTIGHPGGAYTGAYDEKRMVNPRGLVVAPNGWLWVTEERGAPKRYAAYDSKTGDVRHDYWGRTAYGAPGAGMDPQDQTRWAGMDALWKVDFAAKTARPTSILGTLANSVTPVHHRFVHVGDRTFLVTMGAVTFLSEIQKDGSAKNLAFCGTVSGYTHGFRRPIPPALEQAFELAFPDPKDPRRNNIAALWVDKSGDGQVQMDEIDLSTDFDSFAGAYWGHDQRDLTLRFPAVLGGKNVLVALAPQGFYPGGAPRYPAFKAALATAAPMDKPDVARFQPRVETTVDARGDVIFNTDPKMTAFAPDGKLLWTYPNRWTNVHGSHNAPLPQAGELQGTLFFTGIAPLDKESDIFAMNGNHGRIFLLTSDGLYLDEMFEDVRLGRNRMESVYMMGGESFGGFFEKSQADGKYYLQVGGNEYRIFNVSGLDTVQRSAGEFSVSPAQAQASESALKRRLAAANAPKEAVAIAVTTPPIIDGNERDWPADSGAKWDKNGQFTVTARLGLDANNLYLHYTVADDSPWLNNGKDWQLLFKTGDSIDLQLGTDPAASPKRSGPAAGDFRLLIAPFQGKETAVLYRHRVPGTKTPVAFTSPWRTENVDEVKQVAGAKIAVLKDANRYRVEASIPLAALGWKPLPGQSVKADFGAVYGDTGGQVNVFRNYWSNQATSLVNDVPGEIMLSPNLWGTLQVGEKGEGQ